MHVLKKLVKGDHAVLNLRVEVLAVGEMNGENKWGE